MPKVNGHDVARLLKMQEGLAAVPVVMITARRFDMSLKREINNDIDGFIEKPLDQAKIIQMIEEACGQLPLK